jgi:hypothetical protein
VRYQDESDGLEYGESFEFFGSTEEPVRAAIIRVSDIVFNDMISTGLHPRPYLCSLKSTSLYALATIAVPSLVVVAGSCSTVASK